MKTPRLLLLALALTASAGSAFAQFADPFDTISSAWIANRYAPAGFSSVVFDGGNRLRLTLDATGAAANRPPAFSSSFYDIQGMQRPGNLTGPWSLSAQVFVSSAFNTTTGLLAASELWGHTGTTPSGGDYLIFGFTNASPTAPLNAAASDRSFRFQAFDSTTNAWFDLGLPSGFVFDTWHTLTGTSTGSVFEYRLDGALVHTRATVAGADLLSAMVQGYNFGEASGYSVHWDNVTASAIPEPATTALLVAAAGLAFAGWRRRRTARPTPAG